MTDAIDEAREEVRRQHAVYTWDDGSVTVETMDAAADRYALVAFEHLGFKDMASMGRAVRELVEAARQEERWCPDCGGTGLLIPVTAVGGVPRDPCRSCRDIRAALAAFDAMQEV